MEPFRDNILRAVEIYEQLARSGTDFNSHFRIDPATGTATKIGLWSRIRGPRQVDQRAYLKVVHKILQNVAWPTEVDAGNFSACTAMIQESREQLREVQLARAIFEGVMWDPTQSKNLREVNNRLEAQAYYIKARIREAQKSLLQSSGGAYVTEGVEEGWLSIDYVDADWQPPRIAEREFGDKLFLVFFRGTECFIYAKPVRKYLLEGARGGGAPADAEYSPVDLLSDSLENRVRREVLLRNSLIERGGIQYGELPHTHYRTVATVVMPNASHDYSSAWTQLANSAEELDCATTSDLKPFLPPGVELFFGAADDSPILSIRYLDPGTFLEKTLKSPFCDRDTPLEKWLNQFCRDYFQRIEQMPDPLEGTVRLIEQPLVDRYGDLRRYVHSSEEIRGTGSIGIKSLGDKVEVYEERPDGGLRTRLISNDRLSLTMVLVPLQKKLHNAYCKEQFSLFLSQVRGNPHFKLLENVGLVHVDFFFRIF